ncbi:chaplin [Streptomyces sp. NPDC002309]
MRQGTRKGLMTVAAATGVIAAVGGHAHADSGASGSSANSPGVLSGNTVQVPVHVPVDVCGNTISVVGILNPAIGNSCADQGGGPGTPGGYGDEHEYGGSGDHGSPGGGAQADGHTEGSPGVGSGNTVQVPVHVPVNVCGNSVSVVGVGNAAVGGDCANTADGHGHTTPPGGDDGGSTPPGGPGQPGTPGDGGTGPDRGVDSSSGTRDEAGSGRGDDTGSGNGARGAVTQLGRDSRLAQTGSGLPMGAAASLSAGALLAGAVLYRRARASA